MRKIQKVSNEGKLSVFDVLASQHEPLKNRDPEMKQPVQKEADRSWAVESEAPKLRHNTPDEVDLFRSSKSVRSARCGDDGITDEGGVPSGFGIAGRNSLFDSEVISRLADQQTSKEKTAEERSSTESIRQAKAEEWRSAHQSQLGESEEDFMARKASSINSASAGESKRQWVPNNAISMFDDADFERLAETEQVEKEAKQDDSWRQVKKAESLQDRENNLVDRLAEDAQSSGYRNMHQDATDRLFNILSNEDK